MSLPPVGLQEMPKSLAHYKKVKTAGFWNVTLGFSWFVPMFQKNLSPNSAQFTTTKVQQVKHALKVYIGHKS